MISTLTKVGQTTVPADIRKQLDWQPETTIDWQAEGDRTVVVRMVPKQRLPRRSLLAVLRDLVAVTRNTSNFCTVKTVNPSG